MIRLLVIGALVAAAAAWTAVVGRPVEAGGACRGEPVTTERTTTVDMGQMPCFTPTVVEIDAGDTVTWTNSGSMVHNVFGANASWGAFDDIPVGGSASHTFDAAGVYPYSCMLHPGMIGAVVVDGDASAAAASLVGSRSDAARVAVSTEDGGTDVTWALIAGASAAVVVAGAGGYAFARRRVS